MNIEMILKSFGKKNIILKDFTQRSLLKKKRKKYRQAPSEKKEDWKDVENKKKNWFSAKNLYITNLTLVNRETFVLNKSSLIFFLFNCVPS